MGATSCQGRKSREDELGEYKPGKIQKEFAFYIPSQIHVLICIWISPFGVFLL